MAHQGSGQAWGKLVKVDASPGSEILLINRECMVGRKKGALNIIAFNVFDHISCSVLFCEIIFILQELHLLFRFAY